MDRNYFAYICICRSPWIANLGQYPFNACLAESYPLVLEVLNEWSEESNSIDLGAAT
jgi:hypothetical protein